MVSTERLLRDSGVDQSNSSSVSTITQRMGRPACTAADKLSNRECAVAVKQFLLPPLNIFVLAALMLALRRLFRIPGWVPVTISLAVAYLLCTPIVGEHLLAAHQVYPPLRLDAQPSAPEAIVVLSAGFRDSAPEPGGTLLDGLSLERVLYADYLQERTGLPILASGGRLRGSRPPAASVMADFLERRLDAEVRWVETDSGTTWENARHSADLLRGEGIGQVYLVTHAWHMPRAAEAFRRHGLAVAAAPTGFTEAPDLDIDAVLPSMHGLRASYYGLHELFGRLGYTLFKSTR